MSNTNVTLGHPECITLGQHMLWSEIHRVFGGTDLCPEYLDFWKKHTEDGWNMRPSKYLAMIEDKCANQFVWKAPSVDTSGSLGIVLVYKTDVMRLEIYHDHVLVDCPDDSHWEPVWVDTDDLTRWKETMLEIDGYHKRVTEKKWQGDWYIRLSELDIIMILNNH